MRILVALLVLGLTPARLAADPIELEKEVDRFNGTVTVRAPGGYLAARELRGAALLEVSPRYVQELEKKGRFLIEFTMQASSWAFLDGSVEWIADGKKRGRFEAGMEPERDVLSGHRIIEGFAVFPRPGQLDTLATANEVEIRLPGQRDVTAELTPEQIAQIRRIRKAPDFLKQQAAADTVQSE